MSVCQVDLEACDRKDYSDGNLRSGSEDGWSDRYKQPRKRVARQQWSVPMSISLFSSPLISGRSVSSSSFVPVTYSRV